MLPSVQIRNIQGKKQRLVHFHKLLQLWMTYPASQCLWLVKTHFLQLRNYFAQLGVKEQHSTQKKNAMFHAKPPISSEACAQECGKVQWLLNWHPHSEHCGHSGCADSTSLTEVDCTELLILILNRSLPQLNVFSWKNTLHVSIYFCHILISALHFRLSKMQLLKWMRKELRLQQQVAQK